MKKTHSGVLGLCLAGLMLACMLVPDMTAVAAEQPKQNVLLQLDLVAPVNITQNVPSEITCVGVIPTATSMTTAQANSIYLVYIGTPPFTPEDIATFRDGLDLKGADVAIAPWDGTNPNTWFLTTPAIPELGPPVITIVDKTDNSVQVTRGPDANFFNVIEAEGGDLLDLDSVFPTEAIQNIPTDLTCIGIIPTAVSLTTAQANAIYLVYIGTPPFDVDDIATFRDGFDLKQADVAVSQWDGVNPNTFFLTTPHIPELGPAVITIIERSDPAVQVSGGPDITFFNVVPPVVICNNIALDATQEVQDPPVDSEAVGSAEFIQLPNGGVFLRVTHDVADPTGAHIHSGDAGTNGPIVIPLGNPVSPVEFELTAEEYDTVTATPHYINIHSALFPAGEIRGQINDDNQRQP
ncbi:MAG: CHRD domain-containing protein [Candidatus Hydrogenedentes bacterium]|nr:CHRD domain-containing protein [Candidatus Hydrogenedentota bacterium]